MTLKSKPKYLQTDPGGHRERWLISYTDFVTILLILFIAIAAQSLHAPAAVTNQARETQKPPTPSASVLPVSQPQPVGRPEPKPQDPVLVRALEKLRSQGLDSHLESRGLVISLPQAILFPSGEARVMPGAFPIVSQVADVIASVPNKVALVGHADSVPIHNKHFQSNWELSAARGVNLLQVLSSRYGIPESRLSVQSFGSNEPKGSNETPEGRAENRRVEILLIDESSE
jgi:chemotaxis protein MotB